MNAKLLGFGMLDAGSRAAVLAAVLTALAGCSAASGDPSAASEGLTELRAKHDAGSNLACATRSHDGGTKTTACPPVDDDAGTQDDASADAGADASEDASDDGGDSGNVDTLDGSLVSPSAFAPCDHKVFLDEVQTTVFSSCGGEACHQRFPFAAGLDLRSGKSYGSLVGVASTNNPAIQRVFPGDANKSLLWHKLIDQLDDTEGGPMPRGLVSWHPLPGDSLRTVRCWIEQGAAPN